MLDWNAIVVEALKQLRANSEMVRGAKLRSAVAELARAQGADLQKSIKKFHDGTGSTLRVV